MDRRLGRPLPHQLPNPTRADPSPINLSPEGRMRYYSPFPVAIPQRRARSHALLTRPPLDPKVSLDLHVLGLPPAFVLSQDQTLKLKSCCQLILDVRTSAHPQCVTGHPKASSRPTRLRKRSTSGLFLSVVLRVSKETESRTNSEADTSSSGLNPRSVDMQTFDPSYEPVPPAYLFRYLRCQRA